MTLRINRAAKIAAVSGLILATTTGCWGSPEPGQGPNADANGLFPRTYSEQGFIDSAGHLLTATAATARTRSYTFDVDVPKDQAFSLVANCTSGHVSISGVRAPCMGGPGGLLGYCAGRHLDVTVHVSRAQPHKWGLAAYRTGSC